MPRFRIFFTVEVKAKNDEEAYEKALEKASEGDMDCSLITEYAE